MRIKIRNRFLLFLFGWGQFPEYVDADHKCWWTWLRWKPYPRGKPAEYH